MDSQGKVNMPWAWQGYAEDRQDPMGLVTLLEDRRIWGHCHGGHLSWEPSFAEDRRASFRGLKTCSREEAKAWALLTPEGCTWMSEQD